MAMDPDDVRMHQLGGPAMPPAEPEALTPRVTAAALLAIVGVVAVTLGVALIDAKAGVIVFGALVLLLAVLLGFS